MFSQISVVVTAHMDGLHSGHGDERLIATEKIAPTCWPEPWKHDRLR